MRWARVPVEPATCTDREPQSADDAKPGRQELTPIRRCARLGDFIAWIDVDDACLRAHLFGLHLAAIEFGSPAHDLFRRGRSTLL
jgi:hypothetical protein